jgi:hypothetical protein
MSTLMGIMNKKMCDDKYSRVLSYACKNIYVGHIFSVKIVKNVLLAVSLEYNPF